MLATENQNIERKHIIVSLLFFLTCPLLFFAQTNAGVVHKTDSICWTNNVYRCNILEKMFYKEDFDEATKNRRNEELINTISLRQSGKFKNLELLAIYDLNFKLIRLDGYEQRSKCGISYRWYFENNRLTDVVQTRHGFKDASDGLQNTLIKETLHINNGNWWGNREITSSSQQKKESMNEWNESKVNADSYRLATFLNSSIYSFDNIEDTWTPAYATNCDFSLVKTKYSYQCANDTYNIKGRLYDDFHQIRFEVSGGKLKHPQQITYQSINPIEESSFNESQNGLLQLDQDWFCTDIADYNFDGIKDLKIYSSQTDCYYIFNPESRQLEYTPVLKGGQVDGMSANQTEKKIFWVGGEGEGPEIYFVWDNGFLRSMFNQ